MAEHNWARVDIGAHPHVKVYEWRANDGTNTFVPGTDTIGTSGLPVGGAKEVAVQVLENSATVATFTVEGTLDPNETGYLDLDDATSTVISVNVSAGGEIIEIVQPVLFIRPRFSVATSGDCTIRALVTE